MLNITGADDHVLVVQGPLSIVGTIPTTLNATAADAVAADLLARNDAKGPLFSTDERVEIVREKFAHSPEVMRMLAFIDANDHRPLMTAARDE